MTVKALALLGPPTTPTLFFYISKAKEFIWKQ